MVFHSLLIGVATVASSLLLIKLGKRLGRFLYLTSKIPGPTLWQLVTVHAKHLLSDNVVTYICKLSCDVYNNKPWGTWLMDQNYLIFVSDCETISAVSKIPDKPDLFYKQVSQVLGRNILTMNGPEYPQYRKVYGNALRKSLLDLSIPRMAEPMSALVEELRESASSGKDVDLRSLIMFHTIKLSVASFTSNPPPNTNHVIRMAAEVMTPALELIQMETMNPFYYWLFVMLKSSTRRTKELTNIGITAFDDIMIHEKSRLLSTDDNDDFQDILPAFIHSYLKTNRQENDEQLCKEGRILLLASFDTTGFVVNCLLLVLALHQDVQQQVCDEIDSVLGEKDRPILAEDLVRMEYMEMVIKETLRLFPAGPLLPRRVREDTNFNGTIAPAGSVVVMNVMALHRNPKYFPDPLKFNPNRFSAEMSKNRPPYSFLPFSAGFRQCPGQQHAFAMMKITLCHILRNFRVLPGSQLKSLDDIKVKLSFTMHLQESSLRLVDRRLQKKVFSDIKAGHGDTGTDYERIR